MTDLHLHSTASDGKFTPTELVAKSSGQQKSIIALTDHDTLSGLNEFLEAGRKLGVTTIPGVELSVDFPRGELHLLGYAFDPEKLEATGILSRIRSLRQERNRAVFDLLKKEGWKTDYETWRKGLDTSVPGRPHIADLLISLGIVKSRKEAFHRYLAEGRPFFLPRTNLSLEECVSAIIESGGITSVAHPYSLQISRGRMIEYLPRWKEAGIHAVETVHPTVNRDQTRRLTELAGEQGLLCSGGSDFHGTREDRRFFGRTSWGKPIPDNLSIIPFLFPSKQAND